MNLSSSVGVFGAKIIERHITFDKSMWGTDSNIYWPRICKIIKDIRSVEQSFGKPLKIVYPRKTIMKKLRKFI